MKISYYGNAVDIKFDVNDTPSPITLADGYSFEDIFITANSGIFGIMLGIPIPQSANMPLHFPPVNSHSPNTITPLFEPNKEHRFTFLITKFGQFLPQTILMMLLNLF